MSSGNAPQDAAKPTLLCTDSAEPFQVVGQHEQRADSDERQQVDAADKPPVDGRASDRCAADTRKGPGRDAGAQRTSVQLVEGMGADADAEEEPEQAPPEPVEADRVGKCGADGDVGQVPGGVRRVQQGDPVAPTAVPAPGAVERGCRPRYPYRR